MHMFHNLQVWLQRIHREVWYLMELSYSTVCACIHAIIWWRREVRKARRYFFLKSKDFHTKTENRDFSSFMFWIKYLLQYLAQLFSWMHSIFISPTWKLLGHSISLLEGLFMLSKVPTFEKKYWSTHFLKTLIFYLIISNVISTWKEVTAFKDMSLTTDRDVTVPCYMQGILVSGGSM